MQMIIINGRPSISRPGRDFITHNNMMKWSQLRS